MNESKRTLLVEGDKTFRVAIPADAVVTFGPWSPPRKDAGDGWAAHNSGRGGTLRVYTNGGERKGSIVGCWANVSSFRDLSAVEYAELVAKEEGASVWKSDAHGYEREDKRKSAREWVPDPLSLPNGASASKRRKA